MEVFPYKDNNWFVQLDRHFGLFVPGVGPFPLPGHKWHAGGGRLSWGPGWGHEDNGGAVLADNARLISTGHEVTLVIIPHLNIPPVPINILIPLLILASSNTSVVACHSVLAPDGPVAVAVVMRRLGINLACNSNSAPTSVVFTGGTVLLGFTLKDFLLSLLSAAITLALEHLLDKLGRDLPFPVSWKRKFGMFYHRLIKKIPGLEDAGRGVFVKKGVKGFSSIAELVTNSLIGTSISTADSFLGTSDAVGNSVFEHLTGD